VVGCIIIIIIISIRTTARALDLDVLV
jgi:hypothetical protein